MVTLARRATGFCLVTLWCGAVLAEPAPRPPLALEWNVAKGCPDRAAAQSAITDMLAQRGTYAPSSAKVNVAITQQPDGRFQAQVSTRAAAGGGERRFAGVDCQRVAEAAMLIVTMALETIGAAERGSGAKSVAPHQAGATREQGSQHAQFSIGARAVADIGSLPKPTLGVGPVLGVHRNDLHAELEAVAWLPSTVLSRLGAAGEGAEIGLFSSALRGGYDVLDLVDSALALEACLAVEVGFTLGHGIDLSERHLGGRPWGAALAGLLVRQHAASGPSFWLSIEAGLPFFRPDYVIYPTGQRERLFQAWPVVARAAIGIAWIFAE